MSVSMVARRSTTVSIVPFTTSSESWMRRSTGAWACFDAATSWQRAYTATAGRGLIAARQLLARRLHALELVVERLDQMIQIGRHVAGVLGADRLDGVGDRPDPHLQRPEDIRTAGRRHPLLDPVAEGAHLTGERRQRIAGRDLPDNAAQGLDRGLQLPQARLLPPRGAQ